VKKGAVKKRIGSRKPTEGAEQVRDSLLGVVEGGEGTKKSRSFGAHEG
jgi:hypothetical protein